MTKKRAALAPFVQPYHYPSPNIPLSAIRRFARRIAERFQPDKIILFGSYACGTPHADSDVDILVVMPARSQLSKAVQIELACEPPFPLDIIVRTPKNLQWRLAEGESFHTEIVSKGKVLYEKVDSGVAAESRSRLPRRAVVNGRDRFTGARRPGALRPDLGRSQDQSRRVVPHLGKRDRLPSEPVQNQATMLALCVPMRSSYHPPLAGVANAESSPRRWIAEPGLCLVE